MIDTNNDNIKYFNTKDAVLHREEVPFFTFWALSRLPFITHGFSTKLGGVSKGCFASMNLGFNRGDEDKAVHTNYKKIAKALGMPYENMTATNQIHEVTVKLITKEDSGKGVFCPRDYDGVDGFITNTPDIPLVTYYADCVPLYFVDTKSKAIGLSHSGWRGTVKKMAEVTINRMREEFGTKPSDLVIVIGPSICKDCYEVSRDVYDKFTKVFTLEQIKLLFTQEKEEKYQLDLWEANRQILLDAGVPADQIHCSNVCTCCHSDIMYSHRVHGSDRGTLAAFLMLKNV